MSYVEDGLALKGLPAIKGRPGTEDGPAAKGRAATEDGPAAHDGPAIEERDLQSQERFEDELIMHLERDQFVAETSRPVPQAVLSASATAGLWALRVFVIVVSLMVLYTFAEQLH